MEHTTASNYLHRGPLWTQNKHKASAETEGYIINYKHWLYRFLAIKEILTEVRISKPPTALCPIIHLENYTRVLMLDMQSSHAKLSTE